MSCDKPRYNMDLDATQSCCGWHVFLSWNFTKELVENGQFPIIPL